MNAPIGSLSLPSVGNPAAIVHIAIVPSHFSATFAQTFCEMTTKRRLGIIPARFCREFGRAPSVGCYYTIHVYVKRPCIPMYTSAWRVWRVSKLRGNPSARQVPHLNSSPSASAKRPLPLNGRFVSFLINSLSCFRVVAFRIPYSRRSSVAIDDSSSPPIPEAANSSVSADAFARNCNTFEGFQ